MHKIVYSVIAFVSLIISSCNTQKQTEASSISSDSVHAHPQWILQGNIYEVNTRQYTPEGTFKAFEKHLQRLKDMGVQTLWFMPIHPISVKDRKGALGSYYAISNYIGINPEFGNLDDWKSLVKRSHDMGFKVIIDWVANHTGADHPWLTQHPDFYVKDEKGNFIAPFDWTDVRKLDFSNPQLVDSMIASMKFWVAETGIDGFRCDVASEVPKEFWIRAIKELREMKELFMLAESNDAWLHDVGFNATYTWDAFNTMKQIAAGERPAFAIDSVLNKADQTFPKDALRLYFTSNHDENSWNKADYGTMPGAVHAPFAVLTQTIKNSIPLIYSGQEEPVRDSISFFYKNPIRFEKFERANFYKTLLNLRKQNPALSALASFKKIPTSNDAAIYAFERELNGNKVLVVLNFSNANVAFNWKEKPSVTEWKNIITGSKENIENLSAMEAWGYAIYEVRK